MPKRQFTECPVCHEPFEKLAPHLGAHRRRGEWPLKPAEKPPEVKLAPAAQPLNGTMTAATHVHSAIRMMEEEIIAAEKRLAEITRLQNDVSVLKTRHQALVTAQKAIEG